MKWTLYCLVLGFGLLFDPQYSAIAQDSSTSSQSSAKPVQSWLIPPADENVDPSWTVFGEADVEPGKFQSSSSNSTAAPVCKDRREDTSLQASFLLGEALNASLDPNFDYFSSLKPIATSGGYLSGSVVSAVQGDTVSFLAQVSGDPKREKIGQDLTTFFDQIGSSHQYTGCATLAIIVPYGATKISSPKLFVQGDKGQYKECQQSSDEGEKATASCSMGEEFLVFHNARSRGYVFVFKNWSSHARHVKVSMKFTPPLGYETPDKPESKPAE